MSRLYPAERAYAERWGVLSPDMLQRLNAGFILQTLSALGLLYRNMPKRSDRLQLLAYPWKSFLPEESVADSPENPYLNNSQKRLLAMLLQDDRKGMQRHFARKALIKKMRAVKRILTAR